MKAQIIGVLHLEEFPKKPTHQNLAKIKNKALLDLSALQLGGVDAVIIENEFDNPQSPYEEFLNKQQQKIMFEIVAYLKPHISIPLGFCVLLNDYKTALLLAKKFDGKFIRLDAFVDDVERISDGIKIFPDSKKILQFKKKISANEVEIWADIHVKHAKLLSKHSLAESAKLAIRKGASKIIITGIWTGKPPTLKDLLTVRKIIPKKSIVIGSGIDAKNISQYKKHAPTIIIGSAFKKADQVEISNVRKIIAQKKK